MDTLPEISLGTAALVIFGCCAGYMLLRGVARTIVNAASLTFSAWVGFRIWQQAPSLAIAAVPDRRHFGSSCWFRGRDPRLRKPELGRENEKIPFRSHSRRIDGLA